MTENIILYTIKNCGQCRGLKLLLDKNNIKYEINTDEDFMLSQNFTSIPILEVNKKRMTNKEAIEWINERAKQFENR